jgi:hypothetical protein
VRGLERNGSIDAYVDIIYDNFGLSRGFSATVYLLLNDGVLWKRTVLLIDSEIITVSNFIQKGRGFMQN